MNEAITAPVLRYHGAKFRLASWIMKFFPALRNEMVWLNSACVAALDLEPAQASLI